MALALMEAYDARLEEIAAEGVLGFAEYVLTNASRPCPGPVETYEVPIVGKFGQAA